MKRFGDPVLLLLLATSLAGNVYFARTARYAPRSTPILELGTKVPAVRGTGLDGAKVELRYESRPQILYVFSPKCIWCDRNMENAKQLAQQTAERYDFVAVALNAEDLEGYVRRHSLSWKVVKDIPTEIQQAFGMAGTPQTIVVDIGGKVRHVWSGALSGSALAEVEKALDVRLPGLNNATPPVSTPS